jgi:hypothetical protein
MKPGRPPNTPTGGASSGRPEEQRYGPASASRFPLGFSKKQLALAFAIAAISDVIGGFFTLAPPAMWAVDVVTAALLFSVLGWQ